jgi:GNAT superfamily N-acetyltransferase
MKKINVTNMDIELREGTVEDVPLLLSFIRKMAEFERIDCTATEAVLEESLFGDRPAAATLLAFVEGHPIAYAVYFLTFATMVGKLFVDPEFRGKGVAKAMMAYLADIAIENKCGRFEWIVLDWNKTAIGFYNKLGAKILDDWRICRLDEGKFEG